MVVRSPIKSPMKGLLKSPASLLVSTVLSIPTYFPITPGFSITGSGVNGYSYGYNPDNDKPTPDVTYYVDPVSGNDTTGNGSTSTPYKSLNKAHTEGGTNITRIVAMGAVYNQSTGFAASWQPSYNRIIDSWDGNPVIITRAVDTSALTWVQQSAPNNDVYVLSGVTGIKGVVDLTYGQDGVNTHPDGLVYKQKSICKRAGNDDVPLPHSIQTSVVNVQANAASFYDDGADTYVKTHDGREPDANVILLTDDDVTNLIANDVTVWARDVAFWGYRAFTWNCASTNTSFFVGDYCDFGFNSAAKGDGRADACDLDDLNHRLTNCQFYNSTDGDGFNHHQDPAGSNSWGLVADCSAWGNGYLGAAINDNGFTDHDPDGGSLWINLEAFNNYGPNFAVSTGTHTLLAGCKSEDSQGTSGANVGFDVGASSAGQPAVGYLKDCEDDGSTVSFRVTAATHMFSLGNLVGNGTTTGTIKDGTDPSVIDGVYVPAVTVAPAITGTESVGSTLTCSTGTWDGYPVLTYEYQWQNDGGTGTWSDILGATSSTYELQATDEGDDIRCVVTATNALGNASTSTNTAETGAISAGYDADAEAWFTAVEATGATISTNNKSAYSDFVAGLKTDGVYTKLSQLWMGYGITDVTDGTTFGGTLKKIKGSGTMSDPNANMDHNNYSAADGLIFDGSTEEIDMDYTHGSALNDFAIGVDVEAVGTASGDIYGNLAGLDTVRAFYSGGEFRNLFFHTTGTTDVVGTTTLTVGTKFHCTAHLAANDLDVYVDGVVDSLAQDTNANTLKTPTTPIFIGSNSTTSFASCNIGMFYASESSSFAAADIANIQSRLSTLKSALD